MAVILCVDDEPSNGVALEGALARLGHTPVLISNFRDAIKALAGQCFDLVVADYRLSELTGLDLSLLVAKAGSAVPIIIMTGSASVEREMTVLPSGAIDYLTKPVSPESLRIAVSQVLEVARLRKENDSYRRELSSLRREESIANLPVEVSPAAASPGGEVLDLDVLERIAIQRALAVTGGIRIRAAKLLGISERTLRNKLNTPKANPTS